MGSHSLRQISDLPGHLHNPTMLDGSKGPSRAGSRSSYALP